MRQYIDFEIFDIRIDDREQYLYNERHFAR